MLHASFARGDPPLSTIDCPEKRRLCGERRQKDVARGIGLPARHPVVPMEELKARTRKVLCRRGMSANPSAEFLRQRGWFVAGMSTSERVPPGLNMGRMLSEQPDLNDQTTALYNVVESRGHISLFLLKYPPEIAGVGMEHSRGIWKMEFRREMNELPANIHQDFVASMCPTTTQTVQRLRFSRIIPVTIALNTSRLWKVKICSRMS